MGNKNVSFKTKSGREINFTKKHDPTARLKALAGVGMCKPKNEKKKRGGMIPFLTPVLSSVAGAIAGKLFDVVKDKIQGKGYMVDPELYKTDEQKREFLKRVLH